MQATTESRRNERPLRSWEKWFFGMRVGELPAALPGLVAALGAAWIGGLLASRIGAWLLALQGIDPTSKASPVSAITVAVILGLLVANTTGLPSWLQPGLDLARNKVLRLGIVLVGLKLSIVDVLKVGSIGVPVVIALVAFALLASLGIAKQLGVSRELGSLAAASTAICGITATLAVAPVVRADEKEVAYTVANVTLFGLLGMLVYPYVAHALFGDASAAAGLFLGTAIHDTSQVMGAALTYAEVFGDERALQVATVAKLTRNALLVAVVPAIAILHARAAGTGETGKRPLRSYFPVFVLGFVALSILRTAGEIGLGEGGLALGLFSEERFRETTRLFGDRISSLALGTALAAVGATTRLSVLKGLGPQPLFVGFGAALTVGLAAALSSALLA